jgi:hypothetical protein
MALVCYSRLNIIIHEAVSENEAKERDPMQQSQPDPTEKEDHEKDNPALNKVIERNIRTIIHLRTKAARERSLQGRIADAIT